MCRSPFSLILVLAIIVSGCAPANPIARPRFSSVSDLGKAYLESAGQQDHCEHTCVLGFELGKATYVDVKANLPRGANPRNQFCGKAGPFFITDSALFGIAGLQSVAFVFNHRWRLASVNMSFSEAGFVAYKERIESQHKLYAYLPRGTEIYKANPDSGPLGYFGDFIVVSEKFNDHYRKAFYEVTYSTTLPVELSKK